MLNLRNLRTMDFSHLFSIVMSFRLSHSNNNGSNRQLRHAKPVHIQFYQLVKNVFSHPQLWPGHPSPRVASLLFSLSNADSSFLASKAPSRFPSFHFLSNQSILPAKKSFIQSFHSLPPILHPYHLSLVQHQLRPLSTTYFSPKMWWNLNDQLPLFAYFYF